MPIRTALVALALFVGLGPVGRAADPPARPLVRSDPPDRELDRELAGIAAFVEEFTGMKFVRPVTVKRQSLKEFRVAQAAAFAAAAPTREKEWALLQAIGLVESAADAEKTYKRFLGLSVAGYYSFATGDILLPEDAHGEGVTLAHELFHAIQHQHLALDKVIANAAGKDDRETAVRAVVEGQAVLCEKVYLRWRETKVATPTAALLAEIRREALDGIAGGYRRADTAAETTIRADALFPYSFGLLWVTGKVAERPDQWRSALRAMYNPARLPHTTRQVIAGAAGGDPDAGVRLDLAAACAGWSKANPGFAVLEDGSLGDLYLRLWLAPESLDRGGDGDRPFGATADRFLAFRRAESGAVAGVAVVVFDSPGQAAAAKKLQPRGRAERIRHRDRVLVIPVGEATPDELLDAAFAATAALAPPPPGDPTGVLRASFLEYLGTGATADWTRHLADLRRGRERTAWLTAFAPLLFADLDPVAAGDRGRWPALDAKHRDLGDRAAADLPDILSADEVAVLTRAAARAVSAPDTLPVPRLNAVRWLLACRQSLSADDRTRVVAAVASAYRDRPEFADRVRRTLTTGGTAK